MKQVKSDEGSCQYLIRWTNGNIQIQEAFHIFGELTKKRALRQEDHVLALAMPS